MIIIFVILSVALIGIFIEFFTNSDFSNHITTDGIPITFKRFEAIYNINPEAWDLGKAHIIYKKTRYITMTRLDGSTYQLPHDYDRYCFYFSFRDYCKYRKFLSQLEFLKQQKREYERIKEVTECFKEDIEVYKKEHEEEVINNLKKINQIGYEIKSNDGTNYFCLKRRGK